MPKPMGLLCSSAMSIIFLAACWATSSSWFVAPSITEPSATSASMSFLFSMLLHAKGISKQPGTRIVSVTSAPRNFACSFARFIIACVRS